MESLDEASLEAGQLVLSRESLKSFDYYFCNGGALNSQFVFQKRFEEFKLRCVWRFLGSKVGAQCFSNKNRKNTI